MAHSSYWCVTIGFLSRCWHNYHLQGLSIENSALRWKPINITSWKKKKCIFFKKVSILLCSLANVLSSTGERPVYVRKPSLAVLYYQVLVKLHTDTRKHSTFHRKSSTTALPTQFNISLTLDYFFPPQHATAMLQEDVRLKEGLKLNVDFIPLSKWQLLLY